MLHQRVNLLFFSLLRRVYGVLAVESSWLEACGVPVTFLDCGVFTALGVLGMAAPLPFGVWNPNIFWPGTSPSSNKAVKEQPFLLILMI
jgi:hypothetical protein